MNTLYLPCFSLILPLVTDRDALPCLGCGKPLASIFELPLPESGFVNYPSDATIFTTHGNYGSTVFDPGDGSALVINICDACLLQAQVEGRVLFLPRPPSPPSPVLTLWDGVEPDEEASDLETLTSLPAPAAVPSGDLEAKLHRAPWTADQVASLNGFQTSGFFHPFTCSKGSHPLLATLHGWVCPQDDYIQDWAHDFMLDWSWHDLAPAWGALPASPLPAKS